MNNGIELKVENKTFGYGDNGYVTDPFHMISVNGDTTYTSDHVSILKQQKEQK